MPLPSWAAVRKDGIVCINPDEAYPALLAEFFPEVDKPTQYHVECVYQIAKMDVQHGMRGDDQDPRPNGGSLEIKILNNPEEKSGHSRWALANFAPGAGVEPRNAARSGIEAASQGREARAHYKRIRGFVVTG